MYTGFKVNTSINKSNVSGLNESQLQSLQRQVDTYTRKLQLQKRKYFSIQDQHKAVTQEYGAEKSKLNMLKKQSTKAESIMLQTKIKSLEATLDKAVSAYDDTVAYNNRLKGQIDMIRREKRNYQEMQRVLEEQLKKTSEQTDQKIISLNKKKLKVEELKQQVVQIQSLNAQERSQTIHKFQELEKEYLKNANSGDITSSKVKSNQLLAPSFSGKPQMIDTQPLLKFRLKKVMASNKQKLRLIDQYKKHMMSIEEAFKQIKQKSHITDLNEITATFIKSQQQNQSLYNYMDYLAQEIEKYDEDNRELEQKIQQKTNPQKQNGLQASTKSQNSSEQFSMPNAYQKAGDADEEYKQNQKQAENLKLLVNKIQNTLRQALIELSSAQNSSNSEEKVIRNQHQFEGISINITELNIKDYLARLQDHINNLLEVKQEAPRQTTNFIKENATSYSKPLPNSSYDDLKENGKMQKEDKKDDSKFFNDRNSIHYHSKDMDLERSRKHK